MRIFHSSMHATRAKWKKYAMMLSAAIIFASSASRAQVPPSCPAGLELKISSRQTSQGSLARVELDSTSALAEVKGEWGGHEVSFWQDGASMHRAFLGIDLEQALSLHKFVLTAKQQDGKDITCRTNITVRAGHFVVEKLTVAEKYVQPSPEDETRIEKEGQQLHEIYATRTPEKFWDGNFRFPLDGPRRGGNFGTRRVLNGEARSPHSGLDIHADTGTPVHAAQRGRVALAENLYYAGNAIVLDHGMGVYTFYCHLSQIDVKVGDMVDAGALIGLVGATGRVTGPHLHWGLEANEARVNPLQILPPSPPQRKAAARGKPKSATSDR